MVYSANEQQQRHKILCISVGSTKFDSFITYISSAFFIASIVKLGYSKLIVQHGTSLFSGKGNSDIEIESFQYSGNLCEYFKMADVIICHAGAGTCLELIDLNKKFIVVDNVGLADQHQRELAIKLSELSYCLISAENDLVDNLRRIADFVPSNQPLISWENAVNIIEYEMGYK